MTNYSGNWQSWTRIHRIIPLKFAWESNPLPESQSHQRKLQIPRHKPLILWNTWTCYGKNYTYQNIIHEAEAIKQSGLPVQTLVLDDGWCPVGDWDKPNKNIFPSGIKGLTKHLHKLGFQTGIWFAPYLVSAKSEIARNHPDWLVSDKRGKLLPGIKNHSLLRYFTPPYYHLNTHNPEVISYIYQQIDFLVSQGLSLFKLDFLHLPYFGYNLADDSHPHHVLVSLFRYIKEKYPHIYVIACGCPFEPAEGVVDAIRVGPDSTWPPDKSPAWLRKLVYSFRRAENSYKLSLFPPSPLRSFGLDPDVFIFPSEWDNAYQDWKDHKFEVLGLGYSFMKI